MFPINESDVKNYLENSFQDDILNDIKTYFLLKEQDFQYRVYFHIQGFFENKENYIWRTLNMPYLKKVQKKPDIILLENNKIRFAIELKDCIFIRKPVEELLFDIKKLDLYLENYHTLCKCYFCSVFDYNITEYRDTIKKIQREIQSSKNPDHISSITLNTKDILTPTKYECWTRSRQNIRHFEGES